MQASGDTGLENTLRRLLLRLDCPTPHQLGEYALDVLEAADRTCIAAHAPECAACGKELSTLRDFLHNRLLPNHYTLPETPCRVS